MHADDPSEHSLLETLNVDVAFNGYHDAELQAMTVMERMSVFPSWTRVPASYQGTQNQFMVSLEPLVALQPALNIQEVHIAGMSAWFSICLEMVIRGQGGEVEKGERKEEEERGSAGSD